MPVIGSLVAKLVADTNDFRRGMQDARGSLRGFVNEVGEAVRDVAQFGALVTGVGTIGFGALTKSQMDNIATTKRFSDAIGDSVGNVQSLRFAMRQLGGENVNTGRSLSEMQDTLRRAAQGGEDAQKAIEGLGLGVGELMAMRPSEAFVEIADAISDLPSRIQRAAAAQEMFGSASASMMAVIRGGGDEIERYRERAEELGLVIGGSVARDVVSAKQSFGELQAQLVAFGRRLAGALAPILENIVEGINEMAPSAEAMTRGIVAAFKTVNSVVRLVLEGIQSLVEAIQSLVDLVSGGGVFDHIGDLLDKISGPQASAGGKEPGWIESLNQMIRGFQSMSGGQWNVGDAVQAFERAQGSGLGGLVENLRSILDLFDGIGEGSSDALGKVSDGLQSMIEGTKNADKALDDMLKNIMRDEFNVFDQTPSAMAQVRRGLASPGPELAGEMGMIGGGGEPGRRDGGGGRGDPGFVQARLRNVVPGSSIRGGPISVRQDDRVVKTLEEIRQNTARQGANAQ